MPTNNAINVNGDGLVKYNGAGTFSAVTTTQYDVLVGAASNGISSIGPGTAGQVLQSGGNAANPAYSTATYPSTAGTSGNVLTSNGTNWVSSAPAYNVLTTSGTLTNAQIKSLHASPVQVVAAPGNGFGIFVVNAYLNLVYGGNNAFTASGGGNISVYYGTALNATTAIPLFPSANLTQTANYIEGAPGFFAGLSSSINNVALNLYNTVATEIAGNASNDNTINYAIRYIIISVT